MYDDDADVETEEETGEEEKAEEETSEKVNETDVIYNRLHEQIVEPEVKMPEVKMPEVEKAEQLVVLESAISLAEPLVVPVTLESVTREEPIIPLKHPKPKYIIRPPPPIESAGCDAMCSRPTKGWHPTKG